MTQLTFAPFVLGGNTFGWTSDRDESFAVLDAFTEAGGVAIDTADAYSVWVPGNQGGESETIIGEWLASRGDRERVQIATKVSRHPGRPGLSAANIRAAVEESLRRLRTEYVDLCYAHADDPDVEQAEYMAAWDALVREGKVREVGASNFSLDRLRSAHRIATEAGSAPFTVSQDHYNLLEREVEDELLPGLADLGLVEVPYYALASGFLTGKYRPERQVDSARAAKAARYLDDPRGLELLRRLDAVAHEHRTSVTAVSLAWLRHQPQVAAPLASARTVAQLPELLASARLDLSAAELEALGSV